MTDIIRKKVMLVDDNMTNLSAGKNMLKNKYEVYALPSAERLFKFLENVKPDIILLDIEMPVMNGYEVLRIIKADERYVSIPVVFVTSHADEAIDTNLSDFGAADYVAKPFSAEYLIDCIERHTP